MIKNNKITKKTYGLEAHSKVFLVLAILSIVLFSVNFVNAATITTTLNSPADKSISYTNNVAFNASASANLGYLNNVSLWTNITGDWVCVNVKGMKFDRAVEVCQHEVGHEIFAEICEKDMDQCLGVLNE